MGYWECCCTGHNDCPEDLLIHRVGWNTYYRESHHCFCFTFVGMATNPCTWLPQTAVDAAVLYSDGGMTFSGATGTSVALTSVAAGDTVTVNGLTFTAHATTTNVALRQFSISSAINDNDAAALLLCITNPAFGVPFARAIRIGNRITLYPYPATAIVASASAPTITITEPIAVQMVLDSTAYHNPGGVGSASLIYSAPSLEGWIRILSLVIQQGTKVVAFTRDVATDRLKRDLTLTTENCCVQMAALPGMTASRVVPFPQIDALTPFSQTTLAGFGNPPGACTAGGQMPINATVNQSTDRTVNSISSSGVPGGVWPISGRWDTREIPAPRNNLNNDILIYTETHNQWTRSQDTVMAWAGAAMPINTPPASLAEKWQRMLAWHLRRNGVGAANWCSCNFSFDITRDHDMRTALASSDFINTCSVAADAFFCCGTQGTFTGLADI